jgi:spore germination protein YaaH
VEAGWRKHGKRFGAPAAFLLAVTVAVLLVRDGLRGRNATDTTTVSTTVATTTRVTTTPVPPKRRQFYRLRTGETLSDVAIRFNTTVAVLETLNPGIQPTNLTVGQRIRVK